MGDAALLIPPLRRVGNNGITQRVASFQDIKQIAAPAVSIAGQVRVYMDSTSKKLRLSADGAAYQDIALGAGVTDHGLLTGLADDDHTQYGLLAGRGAGQVFVGAVDASGTLTLRATADGDDGDIILQSDPTTERARFSGSDGFFLIGVAASSFGVDAIEVTLPINNQRRIMINNTFAGTIAKAALLARSNAASVQMDATSATFTPAFGLIASAGHVTASGAALVLQCTSAAPIIFKTGVAFTERMRIAFDGPVLLIQATTAIAPGNDHIQGDKTLNGTYNGMRARNLSSGNAALAEFVAQNNLLNFAQIGITSSTFTGTGFAASQTFLQSTGAGGMRFRNTVAAPIEFQIGTDVRVSITSIGDFKFEDGINIIFDTTTGTKIGTATGQKLAFYGIAPLAQQTGIAVTAAGIHAALVSLGLITA